MRSPSATITANIATIATLGVHRISGGRKSVRPPLIAAMCRPYGAIASIDTIKRGRTARITQYRMHICRRDDLAPGPSGHRRVLQPGRRRFFTDTGASLAGCESPAEQLVETGPAPPTKLKAAGQRRRAGV